MLIEPFKQNRLVDVDREIEPLKQKSRLYGLEVKLRTPIVNTVDPKSWMLAGVDVGQLTELL